MKEIEFDCERNNEKWTGTIRIKEKSENHCIAIVESRDTEFTVVITCYCKSYGIKEWCICVPNFNFGCKLSTISTAWNEEQFESYIKNATDRRSLACAVETLLHELKSI